MIIDKIENLKLYEKTVPAISKIIEFINEYNACEKPIGKYEIDGDKLFASVQIYTSNPHTGRSEAHKKYIDVQCVMSGTEEMHMAEVSTLTLDEELYSKGKDVAYYKGEYTTKTVLNGGTFAILFPNDAHCPGLLHNEPETIKKIVFKVKVD